MAEQTHTKQESAQEKYLEILQDSDAYKLLKIAFLRGGFGNDIYLNRVVADFLDIGIIIDRSFIRSKLSDR